MPRKRKQLRTTYPYSYKIKILKEYLTDTDMVPFSSFAEKKQIPLGTAYSFLNQVKEKDNELYEAVKNKMSMYGANNKDVKLNQRQNVFLELNNKKLDRIQLINWFLKKDGSKLYPEMTTGQLINIATENGAKIINRI